MLYFHVVNLSLSRHLIKGGEWKLPKFGIIGCDGKNSFEIGGKQNLESTDFSWGGVMDLYQLFRLYI